MKRILFTLGLFISLQVGFAQVSGPSPVNVGTTQTYTFTTSTNYSDWYWEAVGGEVISQGKSGSVYSAQVLWNTVSSSNTITLYKYAVIHSEPTYLPVGSKTVDVQQVAPAVPNTSITQLQNCNSTTVTRTSNPPASVEWFWQTVPDGTSVLWGTSNFVLSSTQTLYLRARTSTSPYLWSSTSQSFGTITVIQPPSAPTVTSTITYCQNDGAAVLTATGSSLLWYTTSTGGTGSSTAPTPSTATAGTFSYYVSQTVNGCESARSRIDVVVKAKPSPPTVTSSISYCQNDAASVLSASGTNILWYNTPTGGTGSSTAPTPSTSSAGTFIYYTSQTVNGCESLRSQITVTVNPKPAAATVPGLSVCSGKTATLTGTPGTNANTIKWYDTSGNYLTTGTTFTTPVLNATTTYLAESFHSNTGCFASARTSVTVTVVDPPALPSGIVDDIVYGTGIVTINNVTPTGGDQVKWYTDAVGGSAFSTGTSYTTPTSLTTSARYYVTSYNSTLNCESARTPITITVVPFILALPQVETEVMRVSGIVTDGQTYGLTNTVRSKQVTYMDGMSRAYQQVSMAASPNGFDVVQPAEYNDQGRPTKSYLPYVASTNDGSMKGDFKVKQPEFYVASNDKIANDASPYATATFEETPLARPLKIGGVGADWQPATNHVQQFQYTFNTAGDNVRKFITDGSSTTYYTANKLYKTLLTDENGNLVITFADDLGRTVLKRVQLDENINGTMVNWLDTYYIYDDFGRLKFTISPKGVATLQTNSWNFTQIKDQYVYENVFDKRGRLIEKKVPGQAWSYYIYDNSDRLIFMQDGLLRNTKQWLFLKYDSRNRAIMQGLYTNMVDLTRTSVQTLVDNFATGYAGFETRGTTLEGYTNTAFPQLNKDNSALKVLSVNYYDNYDFNYDNTADFSYASQGLTGSSLQQNNITEAEQGRSFGRATGSKRLNLGSNTWLYTYVFYDKYGRVIQVRSDNHLSATKEDLVTNLYDFEGKLIKRKMYHKAGASKITTVINKYEYDNQGRLIKVYQNNNGASTDQLLAKYEYNELGQLVDKKLHGTGIAGSETFLQSVDYRYTIKGQLASINNSQLTNDGYASNDDTNDYFGMELLYNTTESGLSNSSYYNGNISAIKWKGAGATVGATDVKSYKYTYDKSDKLKTSSYQMKGASAWDKEANVYNENQTYDHNGNILTLTRNQNQRGLTGLTVTSTPQLIDNLTYTYNSANGNSLQKVEDAVTVSIGKGDFKNTVTQTDEYTYDTNGNLTADLNKGISNVTYNFLGKPTQITFTDGRMMNYTYDAAGTKLGMSVTQNGTTTTTDYVGSFVYVGGNLSFFGSPEGRVVNAGSALEYQYSIADHQGNTRVVFTSAAPAPIVSQTGFETAGIFDNDNKSISSQSVMNSTTGGTNSQLLNGGYNSQVGVATSLKVYPGDKIKARVLSKYRGLSSTNSNLANFASALAAAFNVTAASTGELQNVYQGMNSFGGVAAGGNRQNDDDLSPKGFITILTFDKEHKFLDAAWDQLNSVYDQGTDIVNKLPFDTLQQEVTIKEEGYVYIFVSNENTTQVDIHFDEFKITQTKGNVIQYNEYYPFGLQTSNSWTRENTTGNDYLYNAANELNTNTGWYEMFYRGYDPALGRMLQIDPYAASFASITSYNYALNGPNKFNDPSGGFADGPRGWGPRATIAYKQRWLDDFGTNGVESWADDIAAYYAFYNGAGIATGSEGGGGGGGRGGAIRRDQFGNIIINANKIGSLGGTWNEVTGYRDFTSNDDAANAIITYNNTHNSWALVMWNMIKSLGRKNYAMSQIFASSVRSQPLMIGDSDWITELKVLAHSDYYDAFKFSRKLEYSLRSIEYSHYVEIKWSGKNDILSQTNLVTIITHENGELESFNIRKDITDLPSELSEFVDAVKSWRQGGTLENPVLQAMKKYLDFITSPDPDWVEPGKVMKKPMNAVTGRHY